MKQLSLFFFIFLFISLSDASDIELIKKEWKKAVAEAPEYPDAAYSGRGIVIPAGGKYYLTNGFINLGMLRQSGCELPVEIWYIGEKEVIPAVMRELEMMGAVCKDITQYFSYPIKGWEVKVHAIIASAFEEVLLIDADNVVFQNPEFLFDSEEYLQTGALFWPDIQTLEKKNLLWEVLELQPQKVRAQESGQVVVNKQTCWLPLQLCLHMNKESAFYYSHVLGDKDTFHLSWRALGYPYFMIPHVPGLIKKNMKDTSNGFGQLQRDFEGNPLFCHTTTYNWAQRYRYLPLFCYYTLPTQPLQAFEEGPDDIYNNFQARYPQFEIICLGFLKRVRELIKLFN